MKKIILTCGIFLAGIFFVNAQDRGAAATSKMVNRLTDVCALTPDQVTKVQPIVADYVKARQANRQQYAGDPTGLRSANKTNNENYKAQLKTLLTPDQQQKLKDYMAQQKAKRQGTGGGQDEDQDGGGRQ